jgi:uncharacterized membrane protein (UPF0127 family)
MIDKRFTKGLLSLALAALLILPSGCSHHKKKGETNTNRDRSQEINYVKPLSFVSQGDTLATIKVAIARTSKERDEGLMDVHHMAENRGMLFIFGKQKQLNFWMLNTPLPLDIIFANKNRRIVRIHHNATPFSKVNLPSGKPAMYVVETNGGFCVAHDIQEGTYIAFRKASK